MRGVLLLAFGAADSMDAVEPFIRNVLRGRRITEEAIERAKMRYLKIGGFSPLLDITLAQARALEGALNEDFGIFVGMRHWRPFIRSAVKEMNALGVEKAAAIIMAPHTSRASTGDYVTDVGEAVREAGGKPHIEFVENWHTHPLYISALVENIASTIAGFPKEDLVTAFSAHALPISTLAGDPYVFKLEETIAEVTKLLPLDWRLAFQSRGAYGEWLGPSVEEVIKAAKDAGKKGVALVPLGFVADHVETLYDIDIVFKGVAEDIGLKFLRVPSLNGSRKFIEALASVVKDHFKKPR